MTDSTTIARVTALVAPLVADLHLDLYDVEFRGGTLRITIDTPPGSPGGVDLDTIALVTRTISRDLDHDDPVPGRYTLEVTSPGLERALRTPKHFQREVGKVVAVRLRDTGGGDRRVQGDLVAATDTDITVRVPAERDRPAEDRTIPYDRIDRARTVFEWGPAPKPGGPKASKPGGPKGTKPGGATASKPGRTAARRPSNATTDPSDPPAPGEPGPTTQEHQEHR